MSIPISLRAQVTRFGFDGQTCLLERERRYALSPFTGGPDRHTLWEMLIARERMYDI